MSDTRKRPWAGEGFDIDNWFRWIRQQPDSKYFMQDISGAGAAALYEIMCKLAAGDDEPLSIDDANVRDMRLAKEATE